MTKGNLNSKCEKIIGGRCSKPLVRFGQKNNSNLNSFGFLDYLQKTSSYLLPANICENLIIFCL